MQQQQFLSDEMRALQEAMIKNSEQRTHTTLHPLSQKCFSQDRNFQNNIYKIRKLETQSGFINPEEEEILDESDEQNNNSIKIEIEQQENNRNQNNWIQKAFKKIYSNLSCCKNKEKYQY